VSDPDSTPYRRWVREHDTLTDEDRRLIRAHVAALPTHPLISVLMPAYETPEPLLRAAIASVQAQLYRHWELCIADDASPSDTVTRVATELAGGDPRIRWTRRPRNGHISAATNTALALATGPFVALMDHDDMLPEHALYEVALQIVATPDVDVIYSDEDQIDGQGNRHSPYFKPMWSPELLAGHNMISHLGVYRRELLERIGGLRAGFEGSQDWDLALRATAATTADRIRHIPAVLYHWRRNAETPSFSEASIQRCIAIGRQAVQDWLANEAPDALAEAARLVPGWNRVARPRANRLPLVSILVALPSSGASVGSMRDEIMALTDWPPDRLELILAACTAAPNGNAPGPTNGNPHTQILHSPGPFNAGRQLNQAAAAASGDILVLLDQAIQVTQSSWLDELVAIATQREVGAAGAKLLGIDGNVLHAGFTFGPGGRIGHPLRGSRPDDIGPMGQLALARAVSAVSSAAMVVRRDVFAEVGGFDAAFAGQSRDVDLCLRLADFGYRIVWTPDAVLTLTAGPPPDDDASLSLLKAVWGSRLARDPYHNPNIELDHATGPLIPAPPRRTRPWRGPAAP
jgi:glycosyltransferase involved in cell wall biosynthesis